MNFDHLKQEYSPKEYHVRNMEYFTVAKSSRILFQVICVLFGLSYVTIKVNELTHSITSSILIAVLVLVLIEVGKQKLIENTHKEYLIYDLCSEFFVKLGFTILVVLFSIFLSKSGVEQFYIFQNRTPQYINVDSVIRPYSIALENAKLDTARIVQQMTYLGEKELTTLGRKMLYEANQKINRIQLQIDSCQKVVSGKNMATFQEYTKLVSVKAQKLSWFVVAIDVLLVVCTLYPTYYRYKSLIEHENAKSGENDEKVQKRSKKEAKKDAPTLEERGEKGHFSSDSESLATMATFETTFSDTGNNGNSDDNFDNLDLSQYDNMATFELKVVRQKRKKVVNELKRQGKYDNSKKAKEHEVVIAHINRILESN